MSFLKRLFRSGGASKVERSVPRPQMRVESRVDASGEIDLVELSGTTTVARDAINSFAENCGAGGGGLVEAEVSLGWEVADGRKPAAISVKTGDRILGFIPGYLTGLLSAQVNYQRRFKIQIFTEMLPAGLRAEAWVWLGEGDPQWAYSEHNPPPLSPAAKVAAKQAATDEMISEAISAGGSRAESFKSGTVDGTHYLQAVEPIKQLKREGRLQDALALCYTAIEGAERAAKQENLDPAPWYTEQAAIIHRKLGQRDAEIEVLKRFLAACPPERRNAGRIRERLDKLMG